MKMFINANWRDSKEYLEIKNPYNQKKVGSMPKASAQDLEDAVSVLAKAKFNLTAYERYRVLMAAADRINERKDEIARLISSEAGIALKSSRVELSRAYQALIFSAEEAKRIEGEVLPADVIPGVRSRYAITFREPVGVVFCITPFNHPLNQVVHKVGPAIAGGNKFILKPSEKAPLTAGLFAEILLEAGLPPDAFALLTGDAKEIGDRLLPDDRVDMVSFTGSVRVGEYIMRNIGIKKACMELGGNDALIIFPDADIKKALEVALQGAFSNSGQRCTSIKRILLHEEAAAQFIGPFVEKVKALKYGDPLDEDTDVGTVIDEEAACRIEDVVNEAVADGAKILCAGARKGALFAPTVLDYVPAQSRIVMTETFGPTAPIIRFRDEEEAIKITNSTIYGLQAGVFTQDIDRAFRLAREIKTGAVMINEGPGFRVESFPFGGVKKSGLGREGIKYAVREMTNLKSVII